MRYHIRLFDEMFGADIGLVKPFTREDCGGERI